MEGYIQMLPLSEAFSNHSFKLQPSATLELPTPYFSFTLLVSQPLSHIPLYF